MLDYGFKLFRNDCLLLIKVYGDKVPLDQVVQEIYQYKWMTSRF